MKKLYSLPAWVPFLFFCALGLFFAFRPFFINGFQVLIDPGDARLNQYILEHSYLWLIRAPLHRNFWNAPFFYPEPNVMAYTDILLGTAPFYWVFRFLGFLSDTSFQLWLLTICALNFVVGYFFLRRVFRVDPLPASIGAFFFGFASPRLCQVNHEQLLPHFWTLLCVWAIIEIFHFRSRREVLWIWIFFASWVLQLYSGFYLGWFLTFAIYLALIFTLISRERRLALWAFIQRQWGMLVIAGVASLVAIYPMGVHYLQAAYRVGVRGFDEVQYYAPRIPDWFYLGPSSWFYSWMEKIRYYRLLSAKDEHRLGIGLISTVIVVWMMVKNRKKPVWNYFGAISLAIILLATRVSASYAWIWYGFAYKSFPGATGIRTLVRIGLLLLIPIMAAMAVFFQNYRKTGAFVILLLVLLEQGQWLESMDKPANREIIQKIAQAIPKTCKSFALIAKVDPRNAQHPDMYQTDAMWASLESGIPTVDGRSGNNPPNWGLPIRDIDARYFNAYLALWLRTSHLAPQDVCIVSMKVDPVPTFYPVPWNRLN